MEGTAGKSLTKREHPFGTASARKVLEVVITNSKGQKTGMTMMAMPVFSDLFGFGVQNPMPGTTVIKETLSACVIRVSA